MRRTVALLGLVALFMTRDAHGRRPTPAESWWSSPGASTLEAPARGVQVLRSPTTGRIRIPGGTFVMGSTDAEMAQGYALCKREIRSADCDRKGYLAQLHAEAEAHPVTISTFDLDRTEVTIGSYARCVSAGVCRSAALPEDRPLRADLPVTQVAASDAADYCRWAGGRLPTEAEWEYAARGGANRTFPWGDVYNPHLANHGSWADDPADATDGYAGLAPVGSFPDGATPLGLLDMAGNAAEWVADLVEIDPGTGTPLGYGKDAETDPAPHTVGGGPHIYRGGSYVDAATLLRSASRDYDPVLTRAAWVGFRCAATPS